MEEYALQWDSFKENIISGFGSIYNLGDYVDCSLACEDGKILQAHKMVLGICSPYFRSMLARNPCKHPTFILKDINHSTMSQILEFMYKGEVLVKQTDFSTFMRISKMFKIKGLMDADDEPPFIDVPVIPPPSKYTPSPKIAKLAQSSRSKPTPTITSIRPASVQSNKRRHESPMQSPTHKQIKYEEESNDPLVQEAESIYEDEVLEDEPDEELEHKYTTTTTYDIQPTDEIHEQHDHDDQEIEQQSIEQHESEMVEEHEELDEDDDDEFDDQGLTQLRQMEAPRLKKEAPKPSPAPKPRAQTTATYTSSTLNLHTAVKNLGLPPMPFSSYKDFITFENKVREDEELMAALKRSILSITSDHYKKFILKNLKLLIAGPGIGRFVWRSPTGNMIAVEKYSVMRIFEACVAKRFSDISTKQINASMARCLKNLKTTTKKRFIKLDKIDDYMKDIQE